MKRTERSKIFGSNWPHANAKSSMLQENNPDAACMYAGTKYVETTERKSSAVRLETKANPSRITPAKSSTTLCSYKQKTAHRNKEKWKKKALFPKKNEKRKRLAGK